MKNRILLLAVAAVLLSGCVGDVEETTTTSSTTTTTTTSSTTSTTATTISYINITSADDCKRYENQIERDNCLLSLGIRTMNMSVCSLIESKSKKGLCEVNIEGEKTGSATIEGYVTSNSAMGAAKGAKVHFISQSTGEEVAVDTTDAYGFFSAKVPSGDTYNVTVSWRDVDYTDTQHARNGYKHQLMFKLP